VFRPGIKYDIGPFTVFIPGFNLILNLTLSAPELETVKKYTILEKY
jgi:hypothetical protein